MQELIINLKEGIPRRNKQIEDLEKRLEINDQKNKETEANSEEMKSLREESFQNHDLKTCEKCESSSRAKSAMQEHAERNHSSEVDNEKRCIFNDRGHCRYGNHCYYKHVVEICEHYETVRRLAVRSVILSIASSSPYALFLLT